MATITDSAVVIRTWDFSETSQTVCLFGREHGMIRGLAKGAKRPRGKFCGGFDLLTLGQAVAIVKSGRDLAQIIEWDLHHIWWSMRTRLDAHRAGMYIADLVYHLVTDHDPHPDLFDSLLLAFSSLDRPEDVPAALARVQFDVLRTTGYRPELHVDAETGTALDGARKTLAFSPSAGGVVADSGGGGRWRVRRETIEFLRRLVADAGDDEGQVVAKDGVSGDSGDSAEASGQGPGAGRGGPVNPAVVDRANRLLAAYIRHVLGAEPATMRMVFPDLRV